MQGNGLVSLLDSREQYKFLKETQPNSALLRPKHLSLSKTKSGNEFQEAAARARGESDYSKVRPKSSRRKI